MKHLLHGWAALGLALSLALAGTGSAWAGEPAAANFPDDTVLLSRGDVSVTYADWRAYLRTIPEDVLDEKTINNPLMLARFMDSLWTWKVLAAEARAAGLDQDPVVQALMRFSADRALGKSLLDEAVRTAPAADVEAQAREYYLLNPAEFTLPDRVQVSHILISTEERPLEMAEARAREVHALAVNGERDFADLAREYSDGPGASAGGDLGLQYPAAWVPPFREAVMAMREPGEISAPVETQFGYHIIRLQEWIPGQEITLEMARPGLVEHFEDQNRVRWRQRRVEAAQDMTGRELNLEALRVIMKLGDTDTDPGAVFDAAAAAAAEAAEAAEAEVETGD